MVWPRQALPPPGASRSVGESPSHRGRGVFGGGVLASPPKSPCGGFWGGVGDTRHKPAYHNGTAWTWVFPSFCEAWVTCFGPCERETALAWLDSSERLINAGCVGHVPEILDGDAPHHQRGCDAQAWGVSELLRVWLKIEGYDHCLGAIQKKSTEKEKSGVK